MLKEDKSMHAKDFFADKIGADTSKVRIPHGLPGAMGLYDSEG